MPKFSRPGYAEPLVQGRIDDSFLMTLESAQRRAIDEEAERLELTRVAYVRKALYHYMNCEATQ